MASTHPSLVLPLGSGFNVKDEKDEISLSFEQFLVDLQLIRALWSKLTKECNSIRIRGGGSSLR